MLVKRCQRRAEVITVEELPGTAGVFGQNTVYRSENFDRPGGSVGEVPDRGGYDVKGTHTGSIARGLNQGRFRPADLHSGVGRRSALEEVRPADLRVRLS